ncbi:hypothetical protein [Streptomyces sp. TLI_171]|uniref:hypothetical protein n=1 Tax=Streptomyces sp. TLI_171 TaxID=1938859 RepID=UPI00117D4AA7|nr:hypothetical protein [Streptomyces sp. TLI_171]
MAWPPRWWWPPSPARAHRPERRITVLSPYRELEKYFGRLEGGDVMRETVTALQDFPAGPLGGSLLCESAA